MSAPADDLELGGEEYPVAGTVRYLYSRIEYEALQGRLLESQRRLLQARRDLRRRSLWGRLWALLPGGNA